MTNPLNIILLIVYNFTQI